MASNGNGSLNGNNTLRSSSASTGSGSSGSVVTVINNDDPMGNTREKYIMHNQSYILQVIILLCKNKIL